jgi:hypothetical protein
MSTKMLVNGNFLSEDKWRGMILPHRSTEPLSQAMYRRRRLYRDDVFSTCIKTRMYSLCYNHHILNDMLYYIIHY